MRVKPSSLPLFAVAAATSASLPRSITVPKSRNGLVTRVSEDGHIKGPASSARILALASPLGTDRGSVADSRAMARSDGIKLNSLAQVAWEPGMIFSYLPGRTAPINPRPDRLLPNWRPMPCRLIDLGFPAPGVSTHPPRPRHHPPP